MVMVLPEQATGSAVLKGVKGSFLLSMRTATSKLFCSSQSLLITEIWPVGVEKRGRTHMWEQAQLTHNFGFQFSENWAWYGEVKLSRPCLLQSHAGDKSASNFF